MSTELADDPFVTHRSLLFTVAYEMLGSAADAEDVLQESWLRWAATDQPEVRDPKAYLVRIVTRQSLNQLRTLARRREDYVGEWLPEPMLTSPDVADDVELSESLSLAMLTVLETLVPAERAVFVLREVFDVPYDEIADAVGKSPAAVRQIAHRAKGHVAARRPRVKVERSEHEQAVERLVDAMNTGELQAFLDVLAPDVVSVADSGGKVRGAAPRPIVGAVRLARYLAAGLARTPGEIVASTTWINGQLGIRVDLDGVLTGVVGVAVEDGRVTRIYSVANPDKLGRLGAESAVSR
ncbi:RNA polymerase sigma-70 factor (ECF subfamily) [Microbacterium terrae]|uniref:ECF RNA polymerase sigma factor SigJ n=1 Tax=Microbacterium terrae TaxID=69369 RepID=A0A0M2H914_9MICO|nr:RNA polymerase sigma-70 factor [Microbacterium terrae]KJL40490.1 ECF RNA polymerase sigma factor SigJ [Microbacterium terrae]MBP1079185.1 RNA polymerase sigma-70 factor (ECF subfamily) [Microbacterium terrae]GLJ98586.1 RNA polymerase sigma24 factor [Microbacterium terrae]